MLFEKRAVLAEEEMERQWAEWKEDGELLPAAFDYAPNGAKVAAALFAAVVAAAAVSRGER